MTLGAPLTALSGPFAFQEGAWRPASAPRTAPERPEALRLATLNVLFDSWRGKAYKPAVVLSPQRFRKQWELFAAGDFDVLALNEVTPSYLRQILEQPWLRERYQTVLGPEQGEALGKFGNLILSKRPARKAFHLRLPKLSRPVLVALIEGPAPLLLASAHLSALSGRAALRGAQLAALASSLRELAEAEGVADVLVMGDLNFHSEDENALIPEGYRDVWQELRGGEPGFTFDALRNPMLQEMWPLGFEYRRMRLDRVLLRSERLQARSIALAFDGPVFDRPFKEVRLFRPRSRALLSPLTLLRRVGCEIADRFHWRGPRRPRSYLACSDHFGLVGEFGLVTGSDRKC